MNVDYPLGEDLREKFGRIAQVNTAMKRRSFQGDGRSAKPKATAKTGTKIFIPEFTPDPDPDRIEKLNDRMNIITPKNGESPFETASRFLGVEEEPGSRNNPQILAFLQRFDPNIDTEEIAWCGALVAYVMALHRLQLPKHPFLARGYLTVGSAVDVPQRGWDLVILSRPGAGWMGHVGFFDSFDEDGNPLVLGGNQGNRVSIAPFHLSRVLGYRRLK